MSPTLTPGAVPPRLSKRPLDLDAGLRRLGHGSFRPGQREAVETLLRERRLLLVAPTGGGKSLVYQLPALVQAGATTDRQPRHGRRG